MGREGAESHRQKERSLLSGTIGGEERKGRGDKSQGCCGNVLTGARRSPVTIVNARRLSLFLSTVEHTYPQRSVSSVTEIIGHDREGAPSRSERDSFVFLRAKKFIFLILSDELQELEKYKLEICRNIHRA